MKGKGHMGKKREMRMKRFGSLVLSCVCALSLCVPAKAEGNNDLYPAAIRVISEEEQEVKVIEAESWKLLAGEKTRLLLELAETPEEETEEAAETESEMAESTEAEAETEESETAESTEAETKESETAESREAETEESEMTESSEAETTEAQTEKETEAETTEAAQPETEYTEPEEEPETEAPTEPETEAPTEPETEAPVETEAEPVTEEPEPAEEAGDDPAPASESMEKTELEAGNAAVRHPGPKGTKEPAVIAVIREGDLAERSMLPYEVRWESDAPDVASVSESRTGLVEVTANHVGTAVITATVEEIAITAAITINVGLENPELEEAVAKNASEVALSWESVEGAEGYRIYRKEAEAENYEKLKDVKGQAETAFIDSSCSTNTTYTYTVRAFALNASAKRVYSQMDAEGLSVSLELAVPKLRDAKALSGRRICIIWKSVADADGYYIYRKEQGATEWNRIGWADGSVVSYIDEGLKLGTTYVYTVSASQEDTESGHSETGISARCQPEPAVITEVEGLTATKLVVRWKAAEDADGYRVYRKQEGEDWKEVRKQTAQTQYVDRSAVSGVEYTYSIRSFALVDGKRVWSDMDETGMSGHSLSAEDIVVHAPKLVSVEAQSLTRIKIVWEPRTDVDGYVIYRRNTTKESWQKLVTLSKGIRANYVDKTVEFGKRYYYTVQSYVKFGSKKIESKDASRKGLSAKPQLPAPKNLHAVNMGVDSIRITWKKVYGADGYIIYRKENKSDDWKRLASVQTLRYDDTTAQRDTTYYYTVCGYKLNGSKKELGKYDETGVEGIIKVTYKWKDGLKFYYDTDGNLITDVDKIIGSKSSYYLEVDYNQNVVTVYAKDTGSNSYNVPVKAFVCSTGQATPIGTFYTPAKYRWKTLLGPCYGQWCTRIHGGVLFHSVFYHEQNNSTLAVSAYNNLGTKCSHGCVRLCCRDSKWIYDHCKLGTKVSVKRSCRNPFGKPTAIKLKGSHKWDPTDPTAYYKCRAKGCHKNIVVGES